MPSCGLYIDIKAYVIRGEPDCLKLHTQASYANLAAHQSADGFIQPAWIFHLLEKEESRRALFTS